MAQLLGSACTPSWSPGRGYAERTLVKLHPMRLFTPTQPHYANCTNIFDQHINLTTTTSGTGTISWVPIPTLRPWPSVFLLLYIIANHQLINESIHQLINYSINHYIHTTTNFELLPDDEPPMVDLTHPKCPKLSPRRDGPTDVAPLQVRAISSGTSVPLLGSACTPSPECGYAERTLVILHPIRLFTNHIWMGPSGDLP